MWTRGEGHDARFVGGFQDGRALVGRDGELAELRRAVSGRRLVTVTGAAGTGKSRLALAAVTSPSTAPGGRWSGSGGTAGSRWDAGR